MIFGIASSAWLMWWFATTLKVAVLLGIAALLNSVLRYMGVKASGVIWTPILACAVLLPAVEVAAPTWWRLGPWSGETATLSPTRIDPRAEDAGELLTGSDLARQSSPTPLSSAAAEAASNRSTTLASERDMDGVALPKHDIWQQWQTWALAVWCGGTILAMLPWLMGQWRVMQLVRRAGAVQGGEIELAVERIARRLHLSGPVNVRRSSQITTPMTVGLLWPVVLLPTEAWHWPTRQTEMALCHELMHVKRYDCLRLLMARVACAMYWPNPLIWWAAARLRDEQERACDAFVIASGHAGVDYAQCLIDLLKASQRRSTLAGLPLVGRDHVGARVQEVLACKPGSPIAPARLATVLLLMMAFGLTTALGSMRLTPQPQREVTGRWIRHAMAPSGELQLATQGGLLRSTETILASRTVDDPAPSVHEAIVMNWPLAWWSSHWAGGLLDTSAVALERLSDRLRFHVTESERRHVWVKYFDLPIDADRYPLLVMKYRATGLAKTDSYALWLEDTSGPDVAGLRPVATADLVDDGQVHLLTCDLRTISPKGQISGMAIGIQSGRGKATFDLLDLRFEAIATIGEVEVKRSQRELRVQVLDAEDRPLPGATVVVDAERRNWATTVVTDASGWARCLPWETSDDRHMLRITAPGMASMEWSDTAATGAEPIVIRMAPTAALGGVVLDEHGQPLAGATVRLGAHQRRTDALRTVQDAEVLTDEAGRWSVLDMALPREPMMVRVAHPAYTWAKSYNVSEPVAATALLAQKATLRMRPSVLLTGGVVDEHGRPIASARIVLGRGRWVALPGQDTPESGRFAFRVPAGQEVVLTISSPGFMPQMLTLTPEQNEPAMTLTLKPAKIIHGRVLDADGKPVANLRVSVARWRDNATLSWRGRTDQNGEFRWSGAPDDEVLLNFSRQPYSPSMSHRISASDQLQEIRLDPAVDQPPRDPLQIFKPLS